MEKKYIDERLSNTVTFLNDLTIKGSDAVKLGYALESIAEFQRYISILAELPQPTPEKER